MAGERPPVDYVFGYGSLVELGEPLVKGAHVFPAMPGRLRGFRRFWGAAMNNWEATEAEKHFLDPDSGLKPRIRVAYLDVEPRQGSSVNGLAIPVDATRLAELDLREVNYSRIDVSSAFEPAIPHRIFTYVGTAAARERCRAETPDLIVQVSRQYVERIKQAFAALGPDELAEYERTTEPLPFPERDLELRYPPPPTGGSVTSPKAD
ncbi:MAG TPA: gamma-glutamylcyclotransferase family protein [Solirubrobacterales bacterium]|nr:gamma-glutamylcyclotransferase family protein [Solirubrobacterales bacterium]